MRTFEYQRPATLPDVLAALAAPEARVLAGGMTLLPTMKMRLAQPDGAGRPARRSAGMAGIAVDGRRRDHRRDDHATPTSPPPRRCRWRSRRWPRSPAASAIRRSATAARSAARSPTTIPAADYPAALVAASVRRSSPSAGRSPPRGVLPRHVRDRARSRRDRDGGALSAGPRRRVREVPAARRRATRSRRLRRGDRRRRPRRRDRRAGPCVFRLPDLEAMLAERFAPEALANARIPTDGLNADMHADAEYRAQLVCVLTRRAVARIVADGTSR